ncbi:hypothetical protein E2C01_074388 [Portunus trituberculatus]|uniref:Uncharacterized protein n=1 Tax=Portunus trituberculatus TaxID=210409 RepID=A0A5B7IG68_PORTR|nr:hypothetical protein [Portunus trituberculatus]
MVLSTTIGFYFNFFVVFCGYFSNKDFFFYVEPIATVGILERVDVRSAVQRLPISGCYGPPVTYSTTITSSACYLVRHLSTSPSTSLSYEALLLSRSWIHVAPFDSSRSVKQAP